MASYLIKKDNKTNQIVYMKYELQGYKFNPKSNNKDKAYISVKEVTIYNQVMIDTILSAKFNRIFNKVLNMAKLVLEDEDATSEEAMVCLDEVELVRQILLNKYDTYLNYEKEQLFLKKLRIIENELRIKEMLIKEKAMFLEEQERMENHRSR